MPLVRKSVKTATYLACKQVVIAHARSLPGLYAVRCVIDGRATLTPPRPLAEAKAFHRHMRIVAALRNLGLDETQAEAAARGAGPDRLWKYVVRDTMERIALTQGSTR